MVDLSIVNTHSHRRLAFSAVFWSCLGGVELGRAVQQLMVSRWISRWQYDWPISFLMGSAFLAYGIFWAVMLLRRVDRLAHKDSQQALD
jgi:hypothetical protein